MSVKEHYDKHLGHFYSWMLGDFQTKCNEFKKLLIENSITPKTNPIAIDLGSAHGIQSIPLAEMGFHVLAVDFNKQLLEELKTNAKDLNIQAINDDIRNVAHLYHKPCLIVCCGDTLSHLDSQSDVSTFIANMANTLATNGKLILSFRDYSIPLKGSERFIPVKSDSHKILTCILDYEEAFVHVTDLLHTQTDNKWEQKVSTYKKIRLRTEKIVACLENNGMTIGYNQISNRLTTIIATKENT